MDGIGIVRHLDQLGRVVLPKETRDILGWEGGTPLVVSTEGHMIVLRRYESGCVFCGGKVFTTIFRHKTVCLACVRALRAGPDPA